jgi:hypothetical protein
VLARTLAVVLALAAVVVAAHALRADHRCADAKARVDAAATADRCGDPRDSALVALALTQRGQRAAALSLARRMTRAHPDDYLGWLVTWRLSGDKHALARAQALNPRATPRA